MVIFRTQVNGLPVTAAYPKKTVEQVLVPLLEKFTALWEKKGQRIVIFLAAPPAAGKSTLALFLEHLSRRVPGVHPLQAVGLDGFHYPNRYLKTHTILRNRKEVPLFSVKGCAETFDAEALCEKLTALGRGNVRFPVYDRRIHDAVENGVLVSGDIILLEGNWLLLDEPRWRSLRSFADLAIFLSCREGQLKDRLVSRKVQGGMTREEAEAFYLHSDAANVHRVLSCRQKADVELFLTEDFDLVTGEGGAPRGLL